MPTSVNISKTLEKCVWFARFCETNKITRYSTVAEILQLVHELSKVHHPKKYAMMDEIKPRMESLGFTDVTFWVDGEYLDTPSFTDNVGTPNSRLPTI